MSEADEIKEEIGWLKLIFAALIAIEVSLVAWVAQNYTSARTLILIGAFLTIVAAGVDIVLGQSGSLSSHQTATESVMEWLVIASLAVLVVSLAFVVYEATNDPRQ